MSRENKIVMSIKLIQVNENVAVLKELRKKNTAP